jgi:hypothetical protein
MVDRYGWDRLSAKASALAFDCVHDALHGHIFACVPARGIACDEVDHLIECRFWLVGALGDHQRIEEPPHGRDREHRSENNVQYFEHPLFRAIINDLRNDADHTLDVRIPCTTLGVTVRRGA